MKVYETTGRTFFVCYYLVFSENVSGGVSVFSLLQSAGRPKLTWSSWSTAPGASEMTTSLKSSASCTAPPELWTGSAPTAHRSAVFLSLRGSAQVSETSLRNLSLPNLGLRDGARSVWVVRH